MVPLSYVHSEAQQLDIQHIICLYVHVCVYVHTGCVYICLCVRINVYVCLFVHMYTRCIATDVCLSVVPSGMECSPDSVPGDGGE